MARLVDEVCADDTERARLVSLLSSSQSLHVPRVIAELLGTRLDRLRTELETAEDADAVFGIWAQRLAGGSILASLGFVATGVVTGGWGALALAGGLASGAVTSLGRARLKRRARAARRAVEQTERLLGTVTADMGRAP